MMTPLFLQFLNVHYIFNVHAKFQSFAIPFYSFSRLLFSVPFFPILPFSPLSSALHSFYEILLTYHQKNTCNKPGAAPAIDKTRQSALKTQANNANSIRETVQKYHRLVPMAARFLGFTYSTKRTNIDIEELPKMETN